MASAAASQAMAAPAAAVDRFSVQVSARAEHDTNVTGSSEAEAKARGLTLEDWIYTPSVSVNLNIPVSRQLFYLRGSAGYTFHDANKNLDSERLSLDTGIKGRVSICDVLGAANYQRSLSSLDDIVLGPTVDNVLEVKTLTATATCARRTGFGVTGTITEEWGDNDKALLRAQDYESTSYSAGLVYTRPQFGTATVFGRHQRTEYVHRVPVIGLQSGYESDTGGVSFERRIGARIEGSVSASYTSVDTLGTPVPGTTGGDFTGFTYSLNANYRATTRMDLSFLFERAVSPSNRFGDAYDLTESYQINGNYKFNSRISGKLGYQHLDVSSKGAPIFAGNLTDSRSTFVTAGLSYRQSKRVSLNLDAAREERRANDPRYNYDNTRIGIAATVDY